MFPHNILIPTTMNPISYRGILKKHLQSSAKNWIETRMDVVTGQRSKTCVKNTEIRINKMDMKRIDHPPQSHGMNPIGNLWDHFDSRIPIKDRSSTKTMLSAIVRE